MRVGNCTSSSHMMCLVSLGRGVDGLCVGGNVLEVRVRVRVRVRVMCE